MKLRTLVLCALILPAGVNAEIYKTIEANGTVRYSDVPPPSNIKHEVLGKGSKFSTVAPLSPVDGNGTVEINRIKAEAAKAAAGEAKKGAEGTNTLDKEAAKRAQEAESQKKADEASKEEMRIKAENCRMAKENLATYKNGGRIAKTNEKGERALLSDAEIAKGKADAMGDVEKYCN